MRNASSQNPATVTIRRRQLKSLISDSVKSAELLNLVYVSDREPGISRVRKGDGFVYKRNNAQVRDKKVLARIKGLVIPPAWEHVWICASANGHIQATGIDARGESNTVTIICGWRCARRQNFSTCFISVRTCLRSGRR